MRSGERGQLLVLVLILLAVGALLLVPALNLATTGLIGKQVRTATLKQQYTRDAGAEYAMWQLIYGGASALLGTEGGETGYTVNLNGVESQVIIRMRATLGETTVGGAENNRIRPSKTVECEVTPGSTAFDDDCLALPNNVVGMRARYTVTLRQISPDTSVGLVAVYDELPKGFSYVADSVTTPDGSFPEIVGVAPTNIGSGQNPILKWDFSSSPIYFAQGAVKNFTFTATINKSADRYCNQVFLKMEVLPNEKSGKTAYILVGPSPPAGCDGGGVDIEKYRPGDVLVLPPNETTVLTYVVNVENFDGNTLFIKNIKDVLPQGGFYYCSPGFPPPDPEQSCDQAMYKMASAPFDPDAPNAFTDLTGFLPLNDPTQTYDAVNDRWEVLWDFTGTSGACALPGGCSASGLQLPAAGQASDNFTLRFEAQVTPVSSGSYYNEVFVDVTCSAPQPLLNEGVTTTQEYCASYSWPTGGTLVPTYDVRSQVEGTTGQGNVDVDWSGGTGDAQLNSWHVN